MADPSNPFLEASPLPYRLPLFALVRPEHYREAIELGMREQRAEVEAVAADPAPPTFENTLEALERSGELLRRVLPVFANASSADTDEAIDALEAEFAPRLAAHRDAIRLDPRLFARIGVLHGMRDELGLDPDQSYLLERTHREAVLAGAALDPAERERLGALNERISTLTTAFQQHLLADTNELALHLTDEAELDGLDAGARSAAREAAVARGLDGWLIPLVLPTGQPALASLTDPAVRDRLLAASRARGCRGGAHDTRATLLELVHLRAERARLLGFANHAAAVTAGETAGTAEAVAALLAELAAPAMRNVARERAELAARADATGSRAPAPADWAFLAEQVRAERHDLDLAALRPYLELDRVLVDGVFHAATLLVRTALRRARRPRRLPPRHARLRGVRGGRHAGRPLPPRSVHPRLEARRCVDELARLAVRAHRRPPGGREQPQRPQAGARRADAARRSTRPRRCSTSSGTPCTASSRGCGTRRRPARASTATSSSCRAR